MLVNVTGGKVKYLITRLGCTAPLINFKQTHINTGQLGGEEPKEKLNTKTLHLLLMTHIILAKTTYLLVLTFGL